MGKVKDASRIAMEEQLIFLVQGNSYLYDISNASYKNEILKQQKWKEIAEIIGIKGRPNYMLNCRKS